MCRLGPPSWRPFDLQIQKEMFSPIAAFFLLLFFTLPVSAQVAGGSITGTVTGESGGPLPDVRISVKDLGTGQARTATTNAAGLYAVPDLPPGNFEMSVSAAGFTTQLWTTISVTAGVERILNVMLRAGDPKQVVRVVAPPALASESCLGACGSANSSTVQDTPLN